MLQPGRTFSSRKVWRYIMETDLNFWLQLFTVAFCIGLGADTAALVSALPAPRRLHSGAFLRPQAEFSARFNHSHYCGRHRLHIDSAGGRRSGLDGEDCRADAAAVAQSHYVRRAFCLFLLRDLCGDGLRGFCGLPGGGRSGHSGPRASRASDCGFGYLCGHCRGGFADERRNCSAGGVAFALQRVAS